MEMEGMTLKEVKYFKLQTKFINMYLSYWMLPLHQINKVIFYVTKYK